MLVNSCCLLTSNCASVYFIRACPQLNKMLSNENRTQLDKKYTNF